MSRLPQYKFLVDHANSGRDTQRQASSGPALQILRTYFMLTVKVSGRCPHLLGVGIIVSLSLRPGISCYYQSSVIDPAGTPSIQSGSSQSGSGVAHKS